MRLGVTEIFNFTVEFEDVDAGNAVHHPNYFKYLERARVHALRNCGAPFEKIMQAGEAFVVAESLVKYNRPLIFAEKAFVLTRTVALKRSSIKIFQAIYTELPPNADLSLIGEKIFSLPKCIFQAQLRFVYVDLKKLKPIEINSDLKDKLIADFKLSSLDSMSINTNVNLNTEWLV